MESLFAKKALLSGGWADDVRLQVADGRIAGIERNAKPVEADERTDCVIPGIGNAHSHAFQRALAGLTERRSPAGRDSFWTWREEMYAFANAMTPERLRHIAEQAYVEMLSSGYTAVAEFHYLHRDVGDREDGMFEAICAAAEASGIRLTYVPVLYERAGFERPEPEGAQKLFATTLEAFLGHAARARSALSGHKRAAIGAHSLRAVSAESLAGIAAVAEEHDLPLHIHVAEQQREVDQALAFYGRRPVRWLLENFHVDEKWCLVHATHLDDEEIDALASSGAVACLCPSTEANLGDGLFPLPAYLASGGRIAIGSDSHISINPFEELRWLEYGQRLHTRTRNVAALEDGAHVGGELFSRAVAGGAQALGASGGGLAEGADADLVCLYGDDPMLVGHDDATRLDALVFSGYRLPVDRVMVAGHWRVTDGLHERSDACREAYSGTVSAIAAERGGR